MADLGSIGTRASVSTGAAMTPAGGSSFISASVALIIPLWVKMQAYFTPAPPVTLTPVPEIVVVPALPKIFTSRPA